MTFNILLNFSFGWIWNLIKMKLKMRWSVEEWNRKINCHCHYVCNNFHIIILLWVKIWYNCSQMNLIIITCSHITQSAMVYYIWINYFIEKKLLCFEIMIELYRKYYNDLILWMCELLLKKNLVGNINGILRMKL